VDELKPLMIAVAGAHGAGKSRLISVMQQACSGEMNLLRARVAPLGLEPDLLDRLKAARWVETTGYAASSPAEPRSDRSQRQAAAVAAAECDLLILVIDACRPHHDADVAFGKTWDHWFREHPQHEVPPVLVVLTGIDRPEFGSGWMAGDHGTPSQELRESMIRAQTDSLRALLPPTFREYAAVGLAGESAFNVIEHVVPALAPLLSHAERAALIRQLHQVAGQSKVRRLMRQLGEHGRALWGGLKARHKAGAPSR
jgi:predicted GTPase